MVIQNSRVLYSSARDKAWPEPVNRAFVDLSKKFGSPWISTLAVGVPGAILCFVPVATLTNVTGVAVTLLYGFVAVAALASRRGQHKLNTNAWRMPLWPAIPVLILAVLLYVLSQQAIERPADHRRHHRRLAALLGLLPPAAPGHPVDHHRPGGRRGRGLTAAPARTSKDPLPPGGGGSFLPFGGSFVRRVSRGRPGCGSAASRTG